MHWKEEGTSQLVYLTVMVKHLINLCSSWFYVSEVNGQYMKIAVFTAQAL